MFKKLSPNLLRNSFDFNFTANDFFFNKNTNIKKKKKKKKKKN